MAINLHASDNRYLREALHTLDAKKPDYDFESDTYYGVPKQVVDALDSQQKELLVRELRRQQAQMKAMPSVPTRLSDVHISSPEITDPESAMALSLSALVALWRSRWGDGWVRVPPLLQERFWAVGTKRLFVLKQLELFPFEGDPEIVRLKDPDANY